MIFNADQFKEEIEAIERAVATDDHMAMVMALFQVWSKGVDWERKRIVHIIRVKAVNPQVLIEVINRPLR